MKSSSIHFLHHSTFSMNQLSSTINFLHQSTYFINQLSSSITFFINQLSSLNNYLLKLTFFINQLSLSINFLCQSTCFIFVVIKTFKDYCLVDYWIILLILPEILSLWLILSSLSLEFSCYFCTHCVIVSSVINCLSKTFLLLDAGCNMKSFMLWY